MMTLLLPAAVLVGWTMLVLLLIPFKRYRAVAQGQAKVYDFKYGESANVPPLVSLPNRNLMNLLEVPVLFYVVCLMFVVSKTGGPLDVVLAWAYVASRMLHSLVHLSYNKVLHRLAIFALSNIFLTVLWCRLLINLV